MVPEDVVVRGGRMLRADLERSAAKAYAALRIYAISVWMLPGRTTEEVAQAVRLPNQHIRVSTVGRLNAAGYDVQDCTSDGHCRILLPDPPSEEDWARLEAAFDQPIANLTARRRT